MIVDAGDWDLELLELHVEELGFLWPARARAFFEPGLTLKGLQRWDERIDAHVDALALAGEDGAPLLEPALAGEDLDPVLPVALAMVRSGAPRLIQRVVEAFLEAPPEAQGLLAGALGHALAEARPAVALAAGARRALLGGMPAALDPARRAHWCRARLLGGEAVTFQELRPLLTAEDPLARAQGWRAVALLPEALDLRRELDEAQQDADPAVRVEALRAAAWTHQRGVLERLRMAAARRGPERLDVLGLLAALGTAEDLLRLKEAVADEALGPARFELVWRSGAPSLVEHLWPAMAGDDVETAQAAALAFRSFTGVGIAVSGEEIERPDLADARRTWASIGATLAAHPRVANGLPLQGHPGAELMAKLELPAVTGVVLRAAFEGGPGGRAALLERFPCPDVERWL